MRIPGQHNALNALAAYHIAKSLKISDKIIFNVFKNFTGTWRRFQYMGSLKFKSLKKKVSGRGSNVNCLVYDDYAHHPTEIKATLQAFRDKYPKSKIICVFQAHQADRLRRLFGDFTKSFKDADRVVIIPSYKVAGRDFVNPKHQAPNSKQSQNSKLKNQKNAQSLAEKIGTVYLENPKKIKQVVSGIVKDYRLGIKDNDHFVVVMMGAGDINNYTPLLLK